MKNLLFNGGKYYFLGLETIYFRSIIIISVYKMIITQEEVIGELKRMYEWIKTLSKKSTNV